MVREGAIDNALKQQLIFALEKARRELVSLHGLEATHSERMGAESRMMDDFQVTFTIDVRRALAVIDAALRSAQG